MLQPSLHPVAVEAPCRPRRRAAYGLSVRTLLLLAAGFLWLAGGYIVPRLAWGMLVWDALILVAALLVCRLLRPSFFDTVFMVVASLSLF